jgi:hypothetical protein
MSHLIRFKNVISKYIGVLSLIVGVVLQLVFIVSSVRAQGDEGQVYIVQHDDSLWKIAEKYLGDGHYFDQIVAATQLKHSQDFTFAVIRDPGLIFSGSKLWIPAAPNLQLTHDEAGTTPAIQPPATGADKTPGAADFAPGGHIAFSFWNNSPERCTYEINVIDVNACLTGPDMCQANRRIFALNNASEPALSPNGERLAFRGWGEIPEKAKGGQIDHPYFDCAKPRALHHLGHSTLDATDYRATGLFQEDSHPDWSPDGRRLLFDTGRHGDGVTRIMTISADGSIEEDLRIIGQQPAWAPDNDRFVYRGCDLTGNRCGLWLARALPAQHWNTGHNMLGPVLEEPAAARPDWSPVDDTIVYQSLAAGSWDLYLINVDGSRQKRLTDSPVIEGLPTWSPDGEWIAYLSDAEGNWGIWLVRADGSEQRRLFAFDGGIFTPKALFPYGGRDWIDEQISWSK